MSETTITTTELVQQLRAIADVYEDNPDLPVLYDFKPSGTLWLFCGDKQSFAAAVKAFGAGEKNGDDDSVFFRPDCAPAVRINGFKSKCCERVQTGTRTVPRLVIPARPAIEEEVIEEHEEPIFEWKCSAFLAEKAEEAA